jgi:hypothetical protein
VWAEGGVLGGALNGAMIGAIAGAIIGVLVWGVLQLVKLFKDREGPPGPPSR